MNELIPPLREFVDEAFTVFVLAGLAAVRNWLISRRGTK